MNSNLQTKNLLKAKTKTPLVVFKPAEISSCHIVFLYKFSLLNLTFLAILTVDTRINNLLSITILVTAKGSDGLIFILKYRMHWMIFIIIFKLIGHTYNHSLKYLLWNI